MSTSASLAAGHDFIGRPHDFDFLVGRWQVANRRLKRRHAGCSEWDAFDARCEARVLLGGMVSVDEIEFAGRGFSGATLRTLDLAAQRWSIYWIDSRDGRLFPPVHGGFAGDRGEFHGDDHDDGRAVKVRFVWERLGAGRARWSQAFALDGVANAERAEWETNWVMEFVRLAA